jgi:hypothetical protein
MKLEMYVDGVLIDSTPLSAINLRLSQESYFKSVRDGLVKKHQSLVDKAKAPPRFVLAEVPSSTSAFVSLRDMAEKKSNAGATDASNGKE